MSLSADYQLERRWTRQLRLTVTDSGELRVIAPWGIPVRFIDDFVSSKAAWIARRREALVAHPPAPPRSRAEDAEARKVLKAALPPLLDHWQAVLGVQTTFWGIKRMKTRWGTCNTRDRRVWFNLALADAPAELLEYVVVHELVHLLEPSHNARFKALMTDSLPGWRALDAQLKTRPTLR